MGTAKNSDLAYHPSSTLENGGVEQDLDETESLTTLLTEIKAKHPCANAICSGAILSTYQRTRVESIALRLGLVPLSPLWQYPIFRFPSHSGGGSPSSELDHIAALGLDARIVKVASAGLDDSLLWRSLLDPKARRIIEKAVERFGGSPLGEGGEYESLVVAGPEGLWKGKIALGDNEWEVGRGEGGEAFVRVKDGGGRVIKDDDAGCRAEADWRESLMLPSLWDREFEILANGFDVIQRKIEDSKNDGEDHPIMPFTKMKTSNLYNKAINQPISRPSPNIAHISYLTAPGLPLAEQISSILNQLSTRLTHENLSPGSIVFTTILLRSMISFPKINAIYSQFFDSAPLPPARVTVACADAMPEGVDVLLSVVADRTLEQSLTPGSQPKTLAANQARKQGLHIQSRSRWCPANIGPYSQAILSPSNSKVYVAGQIPLIPSTMEVYNPFCSVSQDSDLANQSGDGGLGEAALDNFHAQACLSLQHLWRIGRERRVRWWEGIVVYIASSPSPSNPDHASDLRDGGNPVMRSKAQIAFHLWKRLHDPNFWNGQTSWNGNKHGGQKINSNDVDDEDDKNFDIWHHTHNSTYKSRNPQTNAISSSLKSNNTLPDFDFPSSQRHGCSESRANNRGSPCSARPPSPPPFLAVEVAELPMGVGVEWQAVGLTGHAAAADDEDEDEDGDQKKEEDVEEDNDHDSDKPATDNPKIKQEIDSQNATTTTTTTPEWISQIASHPCFRHKMLLQQGI